MNAKDAKEDSPEAILADKLNRFLIPDVKRACLKQYLEACTYKHALAFFQWREKFATKTNKAVIESIFTNRVEHLRKMSTKIENKKRKAMENFSQVAAMSEITEEDHRV